MWSKRDHQLKHHITSQFNSLALYILSFLGWCSGLFEMHWISTWQIQYRTKSIYRTEPDTGKWWPFSNQTKQPPWTSEHCIRSRQIPWPLLNHHQLRKRLMSAVPGRITSVFTPWESQRAERSCLGTPLAVKDLGSEIEPDGLLNGFWLRLTGSDSGLETPSRCIPGFQGRTGSRTLGYKNQDFVNTAQHSSTFLLLPAQSS